jgi:hypothetical protein
MLFPSRIAFLVSWIVFLLSRISKRLLLRFHPALRLHQLLVVLRRKDLCDGDAAGRMSNDADRAFHDQSTVRCCYGRYSLILLLRIAASSFLTSSGDSFGGSSLIVILSIVPVNLNGT